jgi:hypothetical protein
LSCGYIFNLNDKVNKTLLLPQRRQREVKEEMLKNSMFPQCSAKRLGVLGGN